MSTTHIQQIEQLAQERGQAFRVLIVDDQQWIRDVFREFCMLTSALDVELAESGAEAIEKVKEGQFDLVTLDLIMPDMSGLDALTAIRTLSPTLPIIVITGNATERLVRQAGVSGAGRVMYKPVELDDFVAELTSALVGR